MRGRDDAEGCRVLRISAPAWTTVSKSLEPEPVEGDCMEFLLDVLEAVQAKAVRARVFFSPDAGFSWRLAVDESAPRPGRFLREFADLKAPLWSASFDLVAGAKPAECELRVWRRFSKR